MATGYLFKYPVCPSSNQRAPSLVAPIASVVMAK